MYAKPSPSLESTPRGREAQELLRSCVHCGFCLPACPTYRVEGNELDSPRGRIYLVKQLVEGGPVGESTLLHLDRCLTCRACESACPSGVQYGRIVDLGRELAGERIARPLRDRVLRVAMTEALGRRPLFEFMLRIGRWARPLLPAALQAKVSVAGQDGRERRTSSSHARRVILLEGCVQPGLAPQINAAAARVLDRLGIAAVTAPHESCCGALGHHLGRTERALMQARGNVQAYTALLDDGAECVVSTASACGLMVKDYGRLLADDPVFADAARRVSEATRDLSQMIAPADLARAGLAPGSGPRVAWQSPCTLQHGQRINGSVEALLVAAGFRLTAVTGATLCCGSAGTYSLLQPELSRELRRRKLQSLTADGPELIATANIGCLTHLAETSPVAVRHWIELVDEALRR
jgi:glycolate oxidase iron-sulfur subunit